MSDIAESRHVGPPHLVRGAAFSGDGDKQSVLKILNEALAIELARITRYRRHGDASQGLWVEAIKRQLAKYVVEGSEHAEWVARRIVQLGGEGEYGPAGEYEPLVMISSPNRYSNGEAIDDAGEDLETTIRADLIAERATIESYRQMVSCVGDKDHKTRRILERILGTAQEHVKDLSSMLEDVNKLVA